MVRRCLNIIFQKLPFLGLVRTSNTRKQGISALMRVKNEVDWVELSVLSIKDFVDEIIIVDSSTDSTTQIIKNYQINMITSIGFIFQEKTSLRHLIYA